MKLVPENTAAVTVYGDLNKILNYFNELYFLIF